MSLKILFLDIENIVRPEHIFHPGKRGKFGRAAGFCADLAYVLVFGYKWLGEKSQSIQLTKKEMKADPFNDETIVRQAYDIINQADVVVTWYGKGHDIPFLKTRMAMHGLYLDPKLAHVDLYDTAKKNLRLSSNRLDKVAEFFKLPMKTQVSKTLWPDCWAGKHDSLLEMADYCRRDCEVLEGVYYSLLQLGTTMPHVGKHSGGGSDTSCATCGAETLKSNGFRVTKLGRYVRLRCNTCGSSQKGGKA